jgi:hypothetical protein
MPVVLLREPRLKALLIVRFAAATVPPLRRKTSDAPTAVEIVPLALMLPPTEMVTIVVLELLVKDISFTARLDDPAFGAFAPV